ncbi:hypothetical protein SNK04_013857 [Fusarium graminearum]
MKYNSDVPQNTQQGIYMENGSGGFLADLTFVGGNIGAYFGNQQFTTSHLVFVSSKTAAQVHWDWAWTMHDFVIEGCENGLVVTGGAGGSHSTGQSLGSLILSDTIIANTPNGIITSLHAENSTSFLLQNVGFFNVRTAVTDSIQKKTLLAGGLRGELGLRQNHQQEWRGHLRQWREYSRHESQRGVDRRQERQDEAEPVHSPQAQVPYRVSWQDYEREGPRSKGRRQNRRYSCFELYSLGSSQHFKHCLLSFWVYIAKDTLRVPMGSRIIGQAWSQIMGTGSNFEDEKKPRAMVQVGRPEDPRNH